MLEVLVTGENTRQRLLVVLVVSDPGGCVRSWRLLVFPSGLVCVSSYYMRFTRCRVWCFFLLYGKIQPGRLVFPGGVAAGVPGRRDGGWCSVFVEKTNKEKKTLKRVNIFIKSVDTDTETY